MSDQKDQTDALKVSTDTQDFNRPFFADGSDPLTPMTKPELVFGIIGPVGVDRKVVCDVLADLLHEYGYDPHKISVSNLIKLVPGNEHLTALEGDEFHRIESFMTAGTETRESSQLGDALAILAISEIADIRAKLNEKDGLSDDEPDASLVGRQSEAFILDSLKHPEEIKTLRATYGRAFSVISVHADRELRVKNLAERIADSRLKTDVDSCRQDAEILINRDEKEEGTKLGQNVENTFPMADLFIDLHSESRPFKQELSRFCEIVFNYPFHTPTKDESGMFQAQAASWRSADLSRQVGSAICDHDGAILSVGCNEVPKAGGGLYWEDSIGDKRDFTTGVEQGTISKQKMLAEIIEKLKLNPNLVDRSNHEEWNKLKEKALSGAESETLDGLQALNVIEYGRSVHAEMAAISDAARRGISLEGTTMYVNTFPCHICARHIIASGIDRVVFVQPYPKSQTTSLFSDSITTISGDSRKVIFRPFSGIAPRFFQFAFEQTGKRRTEDGKILKWSKQDATTKLKRFVFSYMIIENQIVQELAIRIKNDQKKRGKKDVGHTEREGDAG